MSTGLRPTPTGESVKCSAAAGLLSFMEMHEPTDVTKSNLGFIMNLNGSLYLHIQLYQPEMVFGELFS